MAVTSGVEAKRMLSEVPKERAFYFYEDIGVYTGRQASSLMQFCSILKDVNVKSIEFHLKRGDFENWIRSLKDTQLASRIANLKGRKLTGETLRTELYTLVKKRVDELNLRM